MLTAACCCAFSSGASRSKREYSAGGMAQGFADTQRNCNRPRDFSTNEIQLIASLTAVPEIPEALSGIATNAGAFCNPDSRNPASAMPGSDQPGLVSRLARAAVIARRPWPPLASTNERRVCNFRIASAFVAEPTPPKSLRLRRRKLLRRSRLAAFAMTWRGFRRKLCRLQLHRRVTASTLFCIWFAAATAQNWIACYC